MLPLRNHTLAGMGTEIFKKENISEWSKRRKKKKTEKFIKAKEPMAFQSNLIVSNIIEVKND